MTTLFQFPLAVGVSDTGIGRAAVIGAGSMGAGIAAQFANAGVPVDLLDIPGAAGASRNAPAEAGIERQLQANGFMHPAAAALVRPGNVDDHFGRVAEADWIVEAVVERLDVKHDLYRRVEQVRKPGSIVSSNTSTILRADLVEGLGKEFAASFLIAHFFNPPRSMRLVEIVSAPENAPQFVARAKAASSFVLGKTVVSCRDTPGFIANRIGCYWLAVAVIEAKNHGLNAEEADAVMTALGVPRTGVFGLLDLIGIDLVPQIWGSLIKTLQPDDGIHGFDLPNDPLILSLLAEGRFGRKSKAGFYRLAADKSREALDFAAGQYRSEQSVDAKALPGGGRDLSALLDADDKFGNYAWRVLSYLITYTALNAPEIASDVGAVDLAMALGFAWREGPFRLADRYGADRFVARASLDDLPVSPLLRRAVAAGGFYDAQAQALTTQGTHFVSSGVAPFQSLAGAKAGKSKILGNESASLWDLGDGVAAFEIHTKMNSFAPAVFDVLEQTVARGGEHFSALVLANDDARAFSAGADLALILDLIEKGQWSALATYIRRGQTAFVALKYADFPVVAAAHGLALGGGCEFLLHADAIVAHAELYAGLPETKVGLVPGWGGCTQLLLRAQNSGMGENDPMAHAGAVFDMIWGGAPSASALGARAKGILRPVDSIVMSRDNLLAAARERALALLDGYRPPARALIATMGSSERPRMMAKVVAAHAEGQVTDADLTIAEHLASILTGGGGSTQPQTEESLMALELAALTELAKTSATKARIRHMLATGKPLRN